MRRLGVLHNACTQLVWLPSKFFHQFVCLSKQVNQACSDWIQRVWIYKWPVYLGGWCDSSGNRLYEIILSANWFCKLKAILKFACLASVLDCDH